MKQLPNNVKPYKRTPTFNEESVPTSLLKNHNTKTGVWGVINIEEGSLKYVIEDDEIILLSKDKKGIVEPQIIHHVEPLGKVSFFVEFYK